MIGNNKWSIVKQFKQPKLTLINILNTQKI